MRKIVSGFAASVDGYIEGPNGEYDWILVDKEIDFAEQMKRYDTYFFGRRSYEGVIKMNMPPAPRTSNYVFSTTLPGVQKGYELIDTDVENRVRQIKERDGKDIALFGGASLLASLLNMKLVDEISIAVIPVLLGKGKPMVEVIKEKVSLSLLSTKTYSNGTVQLTYDVAY